MPIATVTVTKMADLFQAAIGITEAALGFHGIPREVRYRILGHHLAGHRHHMAYLQALKAVLAVLPVRVAAQAEPQVAVELRSAEYAQRREALYRWIRNEGVFTWDSMYGEEYALAAVHPITGKLREELRMASELLGSIFSRTALVAMQSGKELLTELGLPAAAWNAVRNSLPELLPTLIGRFDFAATVNGLKLLEFNAETPTDVVEAYYTNSKVCEWFGVTDPNAEMNSHLRQAFLRAVELYRKKGFDCERMIFSSVDWHEEDAGTTRYLLAQSGLKADFVPLSQLRVFEDRVHVWDGGVHKPVDWMYRLHPLEKMAEEQDTDGYQTGCHALDIIARGKLSVVNPAAALLSQSKAMQALIWSLHESGEYYSTDEHETIHKYFLPTYFENRFAGKEPYVTKPLFGREGGAVTVWGADGEVLARDEEANYWDQPVIYQQYADLPQITVETLNGLYCGRMIFGSFLNAGRGSGVVARVGSRITGNMAYYLPLCVQA